MIENRRRWARRASLLAFSLLVPCVAAAETNRSFDGLEWLIGDWQADFTIPQLGDVRPTLHWKWGSDDRAFLHHRGTQPKPDGTLVPEYESMIVWHPVSEQFVFVGAFLSGAGTIVEDGTIEVLDDGRVRLHMRVHYPADATLPFSDGAVAGRGGHTIEFRRTFRRDGDDRIRGVFRIKRGGRWEDPHPELNRADGFPWTRMPKTESAPDWVRSSWTELIGTWVADNSAYRSDGDAMDAYGLEWSWGVGQKSLTGRLYGIKDGGEAGTFWEFREFWHPQKGRVVVTQYGGDGTYGVGTRGRESDGEAEMIQVFYSPTRQSIERVGHRSRLEGDTHTTRSFDVTEDGEWRERRTFVWRRQR